MHFFQELISRIGHIKKNQALFSERQPVYIFHHIPKCGGSSLVAVLDEWFLVKKDYREGWTLNYPEKINLDKLRFGHCLAGHWELDGYHLKQRYPEILSERRFRAITFLRDPLSVQLSLLRYEEKFKVSTASGIRDHLLMRKNFMASIFPVNEFDYKEVLDKYFFIGVLERPQESLDVLAYKIGKQKRKLPIINSTIREGHVSENINADLIEEFRNNNRLDYKIYEYACKRLDAEL